MYETRKVRPGGVPGIYLLSVLGLIVLAAAFAAAYNLSISRLILRRMTFGERLLAFVVLAAVTGGPRRCLPVRPPAG